MATSRSRFDAKAKYIGSIVLWDIRQLSFLVEVMNVNEVTQRVEIKPVAGDSSCAWVSATELYNTLVEQI